MAICKKKKVVGINFNVFAIYIKSESHRKLRSSYWTLYIMSLICFELDVFSP